MDIKQYKNEDCEYLEYELEEDGNSYYFCKIAPKGTDEQCCNFPNCIYRKYLQEKQDKETLLRTVQILAKENSIISLCKDDTCAYKGLDCLRYNNREECTKDRTLLEQENVKGINQ